MRDRPNHGHRGKYDEKIKPGYKLYQTRLRSQVIPIDVSIYSLSIGVYVFKFKFKFKKHNLHCTIVVFQAIVVECMFILKSVY